MKVETSTFSQTNISLKAIIPEENIYEIFPTEKHRKKIIKRKFFSPEMSFNLTLNNFQNNIHDLIKKNLFKNRNLPFIQQNKFPLLNKYIMENESDKIKRINQQSNSNYLNYRYKNKINDTMLDNLTKSEIIVNNNINSQELHDKLFYFDSLSKKIGKNERFILNEYLQNKYLKNSKISSLNFNLKNKFLKFVLSNIEKVLDNRIKRKMNITNDYINYLIKREIDNIKFDIRQGITKLKNNENKENTFNSNLNNTLSNIIKFERKKKRKINLNSNPKIQFNNLLYLSDDNEIEKNLKNKNNSKQESIETDSDKLSVNSLINNKNNKYFSLSQYSKINVKQKKNNYSFDEQNIIIEYYDEEGNKIEFNYNNPMILFDKNGNKISNVNLKNNEEYYNKEGKKIFVFLKKNNKDNYIYENDNCNYSISSKRGKILNNKETTIDKNSKKDIENNFSFSSNEEEKEDFNNKNRRNKTININRNLFMKTINLTEIKNKNKSKFNSSEIDFIMNNNILKKSFKKSLKENFKISKKKNLKINTYINSNEEKKDNINIITFEEQKQIHEKEVKIALENNLKKNLVYKRNSITRDKKITEILKKKERREKTGLINYKIENEDLKENSIETNIIKNETKNSFNDSSKRDINYSKVKNENFLIYKGINYFPKNKEKTYDLSLKNEFSSWVKNELLKSEINKDPKYSLIKSENKINLIKRNKKNPMDVDNYQKNNSVNIPKKEKIIKMEERKFIRKNYFKQPLSNKKIIKLSILEDNLNKIEENIIKPKNKVSSRSETEKNNGNKYSLNVLFENIKKLKNLSETEYNKEVNNLLDKQVENIEYAKIKKKAERINNFMENLNYIRQKQINYHKILSDQLIYKQPTKIRSLSDEINSKLNENNKGNLLEIIKK